MDIQVKPRRISAAPNSSSRTAGAKVTVGIGEPSFSDAIALITASEGLAPDRKKHLITSLRQFAGYLGQPVETVAARWAAIRPRVVALHPVQLGVRPKTFRNHLSNVRFACGSSTSALGSARIACLADSYRDLLALIRVRHARDVLSPFFSLSHSHRRRPG